MSKLKALNLHMNFQVGGNVEDDPENIVGYSKNTNIVLDFGNEQQIENELNKYPWLSDIVKPVIEHLNAAYEADQSLAAQPKEKTAELKKKLKGLL